MRRTPRTPNFGTIVRFALVSTFLASSAIAHAQVIIGPNVNMGGGPAIFTPPSTIIGDPFLQRQNEPSIAMSSRNPCHLLAGANDYRAVDVEEAAGEVADAWLGLFKSFDCGATWTSTLLPGHKLDTSAAGMASPIKGLAAGADPTVRAGTSGLFYYSGIAFNRGDGEVGKVFVARFIDNNNKDGGDPIQYLGTYQIDLGTSGQFLDKPWIVSDVARDGSTCTINGQTVPAGPVYLVYTSFVGGDNNVRSKILFSRSANCGATWSQPSKLSESLAKNQGTTIAIDPGTGAIHIAWRQFADSSGGLNAIMVTNSTDGGKTFTRAKAIDTGGYAMQPFDQVSSPLSFRTNAYPTIAVLPSATGGQGTVFVAWSARGFVLPTGNQSLGDARIVMSSSIGGSDWSAPAPADLHGGSGHQIMPALAFAGGKMALAYYDLRDDRAAIAAGRFEDLVFEYGQQEFDACMATAGAITPFDFSLVLSCIVNSANRLTLRHTLDIRAAIYDAQCLSGGTCDPGSSSVLGSQKVSRYPEGRASVNGARSQLQYNRPNLTIFSKGRLPFIGDYIDVTGQSFVATAEGGWAWNTGHTENRPAPVFHVAWSDNRNVGTPRNANWEVFTPAVLGPTAVPCIPGQVGVRNQDVYTAQLRPSLIVSAPQNSKRVAGLQRSFVVIAQNATDTEHLYELEAMPPAGVIASFDQFKGFGVGAPVETIFVTIPRKSTISRTLFVSLENPPADPSAAPDVLVPVEVTQVDVSGSGPAFDMVYLNPDFENPDFENPDFENTELHNPDFENPDFENPDFENPDFENFSFTSGAIKNPDFENPDFENPDFENPDFENPDFENPDFENPDFENPDFENPDFENPDFENPDFENPDFENGSFEVADTTWPVRNNGNTTSAYKTNVYVNGGSDDIQYQLIVRKIFPSPAAVCATYPASGPPAVAEVAQSVPLVNIVDPDVQTNPFDRNFNDPSRENATFTLAPGERGMITLRAYCKEGVPNCTRDLVASLEGNIALGVVAQGANCTMSAIPNDLDDEVGGYSECVVDNGPPKDIYDPIPPIVAVVDPTLTAPETTILADDADNSGDESVSFAIEATDNVAVFDVICSSATTIMFVTKSGDYFTFTGAFPVGTTEVTCTARDIRSTPAPNSAEVEFLITVNDVTAPSFDLSGGDPGAPFGPSNPAPATGPDGAQVFYTNPTASDSNGGDVTVTCASPTGLESGDTFPIGTTDINCVATDVSGISTPPTNLFDITVADMTPPVITISGSNPASFEAGGAYSDAGASALDAVAGPVPVTSSNNIQPLVPGSYTVTYTATDPSGNSAMATRTVIVGDTTKPVVTLIGGSPVTTAAGSAYVELGATATDLVSGTLPVVITGTVNTSLLGSYTRTYTATDAAGNVGTATRTVNVIDTTPPVITETANPAALLWSPNKIMTPVTVSGVVTDYSPTTATFKVIDEYGKVQPTGPVTLGAGGAYSFVVMLEAYRNGNDANGRVYTITITATDSGGRVSTKSVIVLVPHNQ